MTATLLSALVVSPGRAAADTCWHPPVVGHVIDPFREPACRWCPGNRGLEYRVGRATPVRAVAGGVVTYAGRVAGVGYVVVRHVDGRRVTYGHLVDRTVRTGDPVVRRAVLGRATGVFHFGVRVGAVHVDPAPMLGRLVGRPRLLPLDATPPRPAGPPRMRCATVAESR